MSNAHRPTWAPAVGGEEQGGSRWHAPSVQRSAHNLASHTTLKFRQDGQGKVDELKNKTKEDLRMALEAKERKHLIKTKGINFEEEKKKDLLLLEQGVSASDSAPNPLVPKAIDADDEDEEEPESSDDDDEDDEEELMRELERIKKERAEEAAKKAAEEAARQNKEKEKELMTGNPLLALGQEANFAIKRRWDDDVVFKNQSKGEPKQQKRFINDTIRSDFHKRFLA